MEDHSPKGVGLVIGAAAFFLAFRLAGPGYSQERTGSQGAAELLEQGSRYLKQAKYDEAIEAFTAAINLDDKSIEAHEKRAEAYSARGQYARSQDDRDLEYRPDNRDAP